MHLLPAKASLLLDTHEAHFCRTTASPAFVGSIRKSGAFQRSWARTTGSVKPLVKALKPFLFMEVGLTSLPAHLTDTLSHEVRALASSLRVTILPLLPLGALWRLRLRLWSRDLTLGHCFVRHGAVFQCDPLMRGLKASLLSALKPIPVTRESDEAKQRELAHLAAPGPRAQRVTASATDNPEQCALASPDMNIIRQGVGHSTAPADTPSFIR